MHRWTPLLIVPFLAGCVGGLPEQQEYEGRGVVSEDVTAPEGVAVHQRPEWRVGDRFVQRRGNLETFTFAVEAVDASGVTIRSEESGVVRSLDPDLGELRWELPSGTISFDPVDKRFTWPLWAGKHWESHYVRVAPDSAVPMLAKYHCDTVETVRVPAGTFEALRVWCRTRPSVGGSFGERVDVFWYAPEIGMTVRKLQDGLMTELVSIERQGPDGA